MSIRKIGLALLIPLLIVFTILEIGMRMSGKWGNLPYPIEKGHFNFEWGWQMEGTYFAFPPDDPVYIECQEFRYEYDVNSLGVREREIDTTDTSDIRLFIYGDSFVEGNGTAYDSTWPRRLEELLLASGRDADVYMVGVSSSDPFYGYSALKTRLLAFNPTHVISTINDSDFDNVMIRGGFSRFKEDGNTRYLDPPHMYLPYKYSHLMRMICHEWLGYNYYFIPHSESKRKRRRAADSLSHAMVMTDNLCAQNDVRFLGVIHPTPHQVCFRSDIDSSDILYFDQADIGFPAVVIFDTLAAVLNRSNCTEFCWDHDSHFNARGYRMFGGMVFEAIMKEYPDFFENP